jgi:hypothetical protein
MAVYVDNMRAKFGRMVMCHMRADSTEELLSMADRIGVARKWIQYPGTFREHFDVCLSAKAKAVENGAIEVTMREMAERFGPRRFSCRYCERPMRVHQQSYAENPFCNKCYDDRMKKATEGMPPMKMVHEGHYISWVPVDTGAGSAGDGR